MQIAEIPRELRRFMARIGLRCTDSRRAGPTWNGRAINVAALRLHWHLLHEIGHYLASPPELRHLPNYGLGPDPDTRKRVPRLRLRQLRRALGSAQVDARMLRTWGPAQEAAAAFLTGVLLCRFGAEWSVCPRTWQALAASDQRRLWQGAALLESLKLDWLGLVWDK